MRNLNELIKKELEKYEEVKDQLDTEKANGNLSTLVNLRQEFDETFDSFYDSIRDKYEDDEYLSNNELDEKMSDEDKQQYLEFIKNYVEELQDELNSYQD